MLVMEALQWANESLKRPGDSTDADLRADSPLLDAEVLLAAALDTAKPWLFTHLDHLLTPEQESRFREHVERRAAREPVAYIVGWREFYKRRFRVDRSVLIPRPATELLVEKALEAVRRPTGSPSHRTLLADIGTGSGAIAITLAAESRLPVLATDASVEALAVARANAADHHAEDLVDFRHGHLAEPIIRVLRAVASTHPGTFDRLVLCANLPYLTDAQTDAAPRDVRDYEPRMALAAGRDGLDACWELFRQLRRHRAALPPRVTAIIEIDPSQFASAPALIVHDFPLSRPETFKDLEGFDRVLVVEI
jgi:release factor glutamine methyltransferase